METASSLIKVALVVAAVAVLVVVALLMTRPNQDSVCIVEDYSNFEHCRPDQR